MRGTGDVESLTFLEQALGEAARDGRCCQPGGEVKRR